MDKPYIVRMSESYLVVWKPAGIHTAPLHEGEAGTLLSQLVAEFPEIGSVPGRKPVEPGLLHRIDGETSGLVLVARTESAYRFLDRQSAEGNFVKKYTAVSLDLRNSSEPAVPEWPFHGTLSFCPLPELPGKGTQIVSGFRAYGPGRVRVAPVVSRNAAGASSFVYTTVIVGASQAGRSGIAQDLVQFRLELRKGFRHQVRCHLASAGFPIAGDPLYLPSLYAADFSRMHLYADGLEFRSPEDGSVITIDMPADPELP